MVFKNLGLLEYILLYKENRRRINREKQEKTWKIPNVGNYYVNVNRASIVSYWWVGKQNQDGTERV